MPYLSFDNMQPTSERGHRELIALVDEVLKLGLIDHLLFSHDVCYRSMYHAYGGDGYDYCSTRLLADLAGIGVTEEQFHRIMVDNPRRLLTGDD